MNLKPKNYACRIAAVTAIFVSNLLFFQSYAQDSAVLATSMERTSFGFGLGIDYGGLGGNLLLYPQKNIGIFAVAGYAFIGIGYNFGLKLRIPPKNKPPRLSHSF